MLERLIKKISEEEYKNILENLKSDKRSNYALLLTQLKESEFNEDKIKENLSISSGAFYTLKSRLLTKIQEYYFENLDINSKDPLNKNIAAITRVMYIYDKDIAIGILNYFEKKLVQRDMPFELIRVYSCLKKLHRYSDKYFHYQKLYNKNIAYMLAVEKADELSVSYYKEIEEYLYTGNQSRIKIMMLHLQEIGSISNLYKSERLKFIHNIFQATYSILIAEDNVVPFTESSTEDLLKQIADTIEQNKYDKLYSHCKLVYHYLNFRYYHRLKLHRNNAHSYYELINRQKEVLNLLNLFPLSDFFILALSRALETQNDIPDFTNLEIEESLSKEHSIAFINCTIAKSTSYYNNKQYDKSESLLQHLLNTVVLKNLILAEIEIKLLLSVVLYAQGKNEQTLIHLNSVHRKLTGEPHKESYINALLFTKIMIYLAKHPIKNSEKIENLRDDFMLRNSQKNPILSFINIDKVIHSKELPSKQV
jgi:hypothetical protein